MLQRDITQNKVQRYQSIALSQSVLDPPALKTIFEKRKKNRSIYRTAQTHFFLVLERTADCSTS